MKATFEERTVELQRAIDDGQRDLEEAVESLTRVSSDELTLGGRMAREPWGWIICACALGVALGARAALEPKS